MPFRPYSLQAIICYILTFAIFALILLFPLFSNAQEMAFGKPTSYQSDDISNFKKWRNVLNDTKLPVSIRLAIKRHISKSGLNPIYAVNEYVNKKVVYVSDDITHKKDHWNRPRVTLVTGVGDCEDYAIAKYFILRDIVGIPDDRMKLVTVYDLKKQEYHTVLSVHAKGENLILNNQYDQIVTDDKLSTRFIPLYAINTNGFEVF